MAHNVDVLMKKLEETKIVDDIISGKDLSHEQNFLNDVTDFGKKLEYCEISTYLSKRSMTICCGTFVLTEVTDKKLLDVVDRLLDEHFFQADGLHQLGWCSNYMLDKRPLNYPKGNSIIRKTEVIEFYWFNHSPNRFDKQRNLSKVEVCNGMHCYSFQVK